MAELHKYGYIEDTPDERDFLFFSHQAVYPAKVDLRGPSMPPIVDQGQLGSCTANAIAGAVGYDRLKQGEKFAPFSRLFIYYNEREIEGNIGEDSGAQIRDGVKSVNKLGVPPETEVPYDIQKFTVKPSPKAYIDALNYQALVYRRVRHGLGSLKSALSAGYPVVVGFTVYESFESSGVANTGLVPMPKANESILGGHAVVAVGYDDAKQLVTIRNSWGTNWGDKGYCYMPYEYFSKVGLSSDWWTITSVE